MTWPGCCATRGTHWWKTLRANTATLGLRFNARWLAGIAQDAEGLEKTISYSNPVELRDRPRVILERL